MVIMYQLLLLLNPITLQNVIMKAQVYLVERIMSQATTG